MTGLLMQWGVKCTSRTQTVYAVSQLFTLLQRMCDADVTSSVHCRWHTRLELQLVLCYRMSKHWVGCLCLVVDVYHTSLELTDTFWTTETFSEERQSNAKCCFPISAFTMSRKVLLSSFVAYFKSFVLYDTIRYDTVDLRALKSWRDGQLNLAHGPETKNKKK